MAVDIFKIGTCRVMKFEVFFVVLWAIGDCGFLPGYDWGRNYAVDERMFEGHVAY